MTNEKYKPTKKEVLEEIVAPLEKIGDKTKDYIKNSLIEAVSLYGAPTAARIVSRDNYCPTALGTMLGGAQGAIYMMLAQKGIHAWTIPIATNILSGAYELGRNIYKKAEKRVIENHNKSGDKK